MFVKAGKSLNAFSQELLKLIAESDENAVISPACLYKALYVLSDITRGKTRAQINKVRGNIFEAAQTGVDLEFIKPPYYDYDSSKFDYYIGASLWINKTVKTKEDLTQGKEICSATIKQVAMGTEEASTQINNWLLNKTGGLINGSPETHEYQSLIILCVLYFKDAWRKHFSDDEPLMFANADKTQSETNYIKNKSDYRLLETNGSLTFESELLFSRCSMIVSLPQKDVPVSAYVSSGDAWGNIQNFLHSREYLTPELCELHLPKFDITSENVDLRSALKALGITKLFERGARFTPITHEDLYVDEFAQNTRLKIDKIGLEGTSYVDVIACRGLPPKEPPKPRQIFVNRPFVVSVVSPDNYPLFVGVVNSCKNI